MIYTFVAERCSDLPVAVCCRVMKVSTSGYYQRHREPVTDTELAEAWRANTVFDIWKMSRPPTACRGSAMSSARTAGWTWRSTTPASSATRATRPTKAPTASTESTPSTCTLCGPA